MVLAKLHAPSPIVRVQPPLEPCLALSEGLVVPLPKEVYPPDLWLLPWVVRPPESPKVLAPCAV